MSPAACARNWIVLIGLLLSLPALLPAQTNLTPQGGESAVTQPLVGDQVMPCIALGSNGGIVVWQDNAADPSGLGIGARRLDPSATPFGEPFRVNASLRGDQQNPRAAMLQDGGAVVVWEGGPSSGRRVYARFMRPDGIFAGADIAVSEKTIIRKGYQRLNIPFYRNNHMRMRSQVVPLSVRNIVSFSAAPCVAVLADGSVVVAYGSFRSVATNSLVVSQQLSVSAQHPDVVLTNTHRSAYSVSIDAMQDVCFQRYTAAGARIGVETVAHLNRAYNQRGASIAPLPNGGFVLCWVSETPLIGSGTFSNSFMRVRGAQVDVYARAFNQDGVPVGPEFLVNTADAACGAPAVAALPSGGFSIAWAQRETVRSSGFDIYVRSFDAGLNAAGDAVRANTTTFGDQFAPAIATAGARQVLVWSSMGQDGSWEGVYGRSLADGSFTDPEFRVNTTTQFRQMQPSLSAVGPTAVVVWSSYAFEYGFDLFMQRFLAR